MLQDLDTLTDNETGRGRVYASRLRPAMATALDAVLASTGETASELIRRLVAVHLDAMHGAA